jgi:hypothetical protein
MTDLMFVRLREKNEHEGETYHYWLQVNGNEAALQELGEALADEFFTDEEEFTLRMEPQRPEHEVDVLVAEAEGTYMACSQKFTGRLQWPNDQMSIDDWQDTLYKGSIKSCFTED